MNAGTKSKKKQEQGGKFNFLIVYKFNAHSFFFRIISFITTPTKPIAKPKTTGSNVAGIKGKNLIRRIGG